MLSKGKISFPNFFIHETILVRGMELINFNYVQKLELATSTNEGSNHTIFIISGSN